MKNFLKKRLFVIIVAGFVFGLLFFLHSAGILNIKSALFNSNQSSPTLLATNTNTPEEPEQSRSGAPASLKIPTINVDATIEYVGLTHEGAMDVPKNPDEVAWFNLGPRPGDKGSAVIAGHRGWKGGKAVVFDNLEKLRAGDKLYIEDDKGETVSFVVRESRVYDAEAYAPEVFASQDGAHLNLITCVGDWDKSKKSYTKRLVIFTDRTE
jgi:LPXTG-site transpeptidase (sortase) family protein